jgi:hypothetical protein
MNGVTFPYDVPVDVTDLTLVGKLSHNSHFELVEDDDAILPKVLHDPEVQTSDEDHGDAPEVLTVKWGGPKSKWRIMLGDDLIQKGFETKEDAEDVIKAMDAE